MASATAMPTNAKSGWRGSSRQPFAYQVAVHGTAERAEQQHRGEVSAGSVGSTGFDSPLLTAPSQVAIVTLMVGGAVGGLAGAYLALPIAAVIRVVWRRLSASPA